MKAFILTLLLLPTFLLAKTQDLVFKFPETNWHTDYETSVGEYTMTEMTKDGETVQNWTELVTMEKLPRQDTSFENYYEAKIESLQGFVSGAKVHHRIISKDSNSIFFEWWIEKPHFQAQHEWCRLIQTDLDWFILRYTTKKLDHLDLTRAKWEKPIQEAVIGSLDDMLESSNWTIRLNILNQKYSLEVPKNWNHTPLKNEKMNPTAFIDLFAIPHQKGSLIIDEVQEHHVGWSQKDYSDQFVKHFNQMGKCELIRYETIILPSGETIDGAIFGPMTMGENIVVKGFVCTVPIKNNYLKVFATAPLASFESELEHFKEVVKSIKPL